MDPIRNVILFNPSPDGWQFFCNTVAEQAQVIQIHELGSDHCTVMAGMQARSPLQIHLPLSEAFGSGGEWLDRFLGKLRSPCLLLASDAVAATRLRALCASPSVDMIGLRTDLADLVPDLESETALRSHKIDMGLGALGLSEISFFSEPRRRDILDAATGSFAASAQRRLRQQSQIYNVSDLALISGIYPVETEGEWTWAWTGPERLSTFLAPAHGGQTTRYTLFFFANQLPLLDRTLQILIDGEPAAARYFPDENKVELMRARNNSRCFNRFDLLHSDLISSNDGSKRLGFALFKLKIEVDP